MLYHPGKTALCASMLLLCRILGAQQLTGSISGTVADKSGSPIVGASIQLVSETTGASREGGSDAEGTFQFPAIAAGMVPDCRATPALHTSQPMKTPHQPHPP